MTAIGRLPRPPQIPHTHPRILPLHIQALAYAQANGGVLILLLHLRKLPMPCGAISMNLGLGAR